MEGLLRRLSSDGSEAENALRVIAFFERLVQARGGVEELVRSSARLIGAPAGFTDEASLLSAAFDDHGHRIPSQRPQGALSKAVANDQGFFGTVWINQAPDNLSLSELVIERMALSAAIILGRTADRPMAVETSELAKILAPESSREQRTIAARTLGFRADWAINVLVIDSAARLVDADQSVQDWAKKNNLRSSHLQIDEKFLVALVHDVGSAVTLPHPSWEMVSAFGSRTGITEAHDSLATAIQAIHLASRELGPTHVDYESLGPLSHLVEIDPRSAGSSQMVKQLVFLSQSDSGRAEIRALDAFCRHRSLRTAAAELNLHHSSLAHRLKNAQRKLSVDLSNSEGLFQLSLSLELYRIAAWS